MPSLKYLVLDVLKPHLPDNLEFARELASLNVDYRVNINVQEMDEKTETLLVCIEGQDIDFSAVKSIIKKMGGSLHSIDEVEMVGSPAESK